MEGGLEHFMDLIDLVLDSSSTLPGGKFNMLYSSCIYLPCHWKAQLWCVSVYEVLRKCPILTGFIPLGPFAATIALGQTRM